MAGIQCSVACWSLAHGRYPATGAEAAAGHTLPFVSCWPALIVPRGRSLDKTLCPDFAHRNRTLPQQSTLQVCVSRLFALGWKSAYHSSPHCKQWYVLAEVSSRSCCRRRPCLRARPRTKEQSRAASARLAAPALVAERGGGGAACVCRVIVPHALRCTRRWARLVTQAATREDGL